MTNTRPSAAKRIADGLVRLLQTVTCWKPAGRPLDVAAATGLASRGAATGPVSAPRMATIAAKMARRLPCPSREGTAGDMRLNLLGDGRDPRPPWSHDPAEPSPKPTIGPRPGRR